jgi:hypothetical protein
MKTKKTGNENLKWIQKLYCNNCTSMAVVTIYIKEKKAILVRSCGGPQGCETRRLPHFLDIYGGEADSLSHRPPFTPQEDSWYSFLSRLQGHSATGRIRPTEQSNESNPRPSGSKRSTSTNYTTVTPLPYTYIGKTNFTMCLGVLF